MNSSTKGCAACKYQRRKCATDCIFAPYFPHDRQEQFLNAHKLFGVGKINNLIKPLDPVRRDVAMSTIIYESDMRANDPVDGCVGYIQRIRSQIVKHEAELQVVLQQLAFFRTHAQHQRFVQENVQYDPNITDNILNVMDPLTLYNTIDVNDNVAHFHGQLLPQEDGINDGVGLENVNVWTLQNSAYQYDQANL